MRSLDDLTSTTEPAWPSVLEWVRGAIRPIEVLAADDVSRRKALLDLQITTRSPMGAIVFETGGLLVDAGWLRILGSGCPRLPRSIPDWNVGRNGSALGQPAPFLLIADDAAGGFFAISGGGLPGALGGVAYFAPDTLDWQDLEVSYSGFVHFALSGDLDSFYENLRWPGWRDEVGSLRGDHAMSFYPYLWSKGTPISQRSRRPVPIDELWRLQHDLRAQLYQAG